MTGKGAVIFTVDGDSGWWRIAATGELEGKTVELKWVYGMKSIPGAVSIDGKKMFIGNVGEKLYNTFGWNGGKRIGIGKEDAGLSDILLATCWEGNDVFSGRFRGKMPDLGEWTFFRVAFADLGNGGTHVPLVIFAEPEEMEDLEGTAEWILSENRKKIETAMKKWESDWNAGMYAYASAEGDVVVTGGERYRRNESPDKFMWNKWCSGMTEKFMSASADDVFVYVGPYLIKGEFMDWDSRPFFMSQDGERVVMGKPGTAHYEEEDRLAGRLKKNGMDADSGVRGRVFLPKVEYGGRHWSMDSGKKMMSSWVGKWFGTDGKGKFAKFPLVAYWDAYFSDEPDDGEIRRMSDNVVREYNRLQRSGFSRYVLAWGNFLYFVDMDSGKAIRKETLTREERDGNEKRLAIHLASQEDKRNYFRKFREERDSRNQEVYNHTPSKTEAEYRWMNTIGDSREERYGRDMAVLEGTEINRKNEIRKMRMRRLNRGYRGLMESMGKADVGSRVADIYRREYPTDDIWTDLDRNMTVEDAAEELVTSGWDDGSIYAYDSICRERMMEIIANVYGVSYNTLYEIWLADGYYGDFDGKDPEEAREFAELFM